MYIFEKGSWVDTRKDVWRELKLLRERKNIYEMYVKNENKYICILNKQMK